jgi:hypothetical protein
MQAFYAQPGYDALKKRMLDAVKQPSDDADSSLRGDEAD